MWGVKDGAILSNDYDAAMQRRIAHLDMDAFYASVELLRYPELRGQPVVIAGRLHAAAREGEFARLKDYVGRGVATTATYEARALGVNSAMGLMKAARLAPDAILLPVDFDQYRRYSRLFKAAVAAIAPRMEDRGIDEIYIDLSELPDDSLTLARRLKAAVHAATGLTCSIGITPNKLLSKIASELDKPDGITVLTAEDVAIRVWPLAVRKLHGVGPRAGERLAAIGVTTIGQLAALSPSTLEDTFGARYGRWLFEAAHGRDDRPLVTHSEPKSISRETTFERDLHAVRDRQALSGLLVDLCTRVAEDLKRKGYCAKTIGVKLRYADFTVATRDHTVPVASRDAQEILRAARECLKRVKLDQRLRLLGVRTSALIREEDAARRPPESPLSLALFDD